MIDSAASRASSSLPNPQSNLASHASTQKHQRPYLRNTVSVYGPTRLVRLPRFERRHFGMRKGIVVTLEVFAGKGHPRARRLSPVPRIRIVSCVGMDNLRFAVDGIEQIQASTHVAAIILWKVYAACSRCEIVLQSLDAADEPSVMRALPLGLRHSFLLVVRKNYFN